MNVDFPLNSDMAQFVRQQLESGRFQSEGELIGAALRLLERQVQTPLPWPDKQGQDKKVTGSPLADSASGNRWPNVSVLASHKQAATQPATRSPRGILADIRSHISPDDIKEARMELWSGFPLGDA